MMNPITTKQPKFQAFSGVRIEHLLAGISGGVASTLLLHPLDLMKIRFAVSDVHPSSSASSSAAAAAAAAPTPARPQYNGLTNAMVQVFRDEGIRGLYRGVTPNVWGAGSAWGLYFLFYNTIKTWYQGGNAKVHIGPTLHMVAAAEAGILTLVMTNPIWVIKTRLCLQFESSSASTKVSDPHRYKGMVDAFVKTYKYEGMRGLYKGFVPGVFGVSHGALQFMAYEEMKAQYNRYRNLPIDARLTSFEYLSFAALSKLFAAVTTYPYQVLRARMQDQHSTYINLRHCIKETFRRNGFIGYYKGMYPYLLRMVPATAITFVTYEKMLQLLQSFSENSESQSVKKDK